MLQFKVPQNIKMKDQIIGPLTLEQFLYILFASGIIYVTYIYVGYNNYFYAIGIPVALLAIGFAFVPINEQPFSKFVTNLILFLSRPKTLLWLQLPPPVFETAPKATKAEEKEEKELLKQPEEVKSQLQQLSLILDTQITAKNIRDKQNDLNINAPEHTPKPQSKLPKNTTDISIGQNIQEKFKNISSTISGIFKKKEAPSATNEVVEKQKEDKKQKMLEITKKTSK